MGSNRRDVQLIVRAKTEGERTVQALGDALVTLFNAAESGSGELGQIAQAILSVDKAAATLLPAVDSATAAFERQQRGLQSTRDELESVEAQIRNGKAALDSLTKSSQAAGADQAAYAAKIKGTEAALTGLQNKQRQLVTSIKQQETALAGSRNSLQQMASSANAVEAALTGMGDAGARASTVAAAAAEQHTQALKEQAAAAREAAQAEQARSKFDSFLGITSNPNGAQARQSAAVIEAALQEQDRLALAAARLRREMDPLKAIWDDYNVRLAEATKLQQAGVISAEELAQAEAALKRAAQATADHLDRVGRGEKGKIGLFGLKPYELTNLGYQVNDVFTQLASGTPIMQVLAQQGGQLLQLFPRIGSALVAALTNPAILAAAATFAAIALAVKRLHDESVRLKTFAADLRLIDDASGNTATSLEAVTRELIHMGVASDKASAAVQALLFKHMDPARIKILAEAAREMADILGEEVPQAAEQLATGLNGGYEQLVQLDKLLHNSLTPDELDYFRTLYEGGEQQRANAEATKLITQRLKESHDELKEGDKVTRTLGQAWDDLMDSFAHSGAIQNVYDNLTGLLDLLNKAIKFLQEHGNSSALYAGIPGMQGYALQSLVNQPAQDKAQQQKAYFESLRQFDTPQGAGGASAISPEEQERRNALKQQAQVDIQIINLETRLAAARREGNAKLVAQLQGEIAATRARQQAHDGFTAQAQQDVAVQQALADIEAQRIANGKSLLQGAQQFLGYREDHPQDMRNLGDFFKLNGVQLDPEKLKWCAAFVNALLGAKGLPQTGSNMAASFRKYGDKVTNPEPGDIVIIKGGGHVGLFAGTAPGGGIQVLGGNQGRAGGGSVNISTYKRSSIEQFRRAPLPNESAASAADLLNQQLDKQTAFNTALQTTNDERAKEIAQLQRIQKLDAAATLEEQRRQAIEDEVFKAQQQAAAQHVEFTDKERKAIEASVGAQWDLVHAEEKAAAIVSAKSSVRDAILAQIEQARELGDEGTLKSLEAQLKDVDAALLKAIEDNIAYWDSIGNTEKAEAARRALEQVKRSIPDVEKQQPILDLTGSLDHAQNVRGEIRQRIDYLNEIGETDAAEKLRQQMMGLDGEILTTIDHLIEMWSVSSRPEAAETIAHLQNMRDEIIATQQQIRITAGDIQQAFAGDLTNAFDTFAQRVAQGKNVFGSLAIAAGQFAADFLRDLGTMILKAASLKLAMKIGFGGLANGMTGLFNAAPLTAAGGAVAAGGAAVTAGATALGVSAASLMAAATMLMSANALGGGGGGGGGNAWGIISALGDVGIYHSGGIAGAARMTRSVDPSIFIGAARYHKGGFAGLHPGEVPSILQQNEEILTTSDPRHRFNGGIAAGGGGGGGGPTRVIGVFDPEEIPRAMNGTSGEKVMWAFIRRNRTAIAQEIGK